MGVNYNPRIVTDGLVLCLDAANLKSYPGTGTSWTDLIGNSNATLINSPTFVNNVFTFNGINNYAQTSSVNTQLEYSFMFFCKWLSTTSFSSRCFGLPNYGTYAILEPTNVGYHYNPLGGSPPAVTIASGVNVGLNNWCHIAVTESRANLLAKIYINGTIRNTTSVVSASGFTGPVNIGAQKPADSTVANCQISGFSLYNKVLSDAQILQNFNALRGRFGI